MTASPLFASVPVIAITVHSTILPAILCAFSLQLRGWSLAHSPRKVETVFRVLEKLPDSMPGQGGSPKEAVWVSELPTNRQGGVDLRAVTT